MTAHFNNDWEQLLTPEFEQPYYKELHEKLKQEYMHYHICPGMYDLFNAFHATSFENVKVVSVNGDRATVKLLQHYRSANLSTSSNKTLNLMLQDGKWLIVQERVGG